MSVQTHGAKKGCQDLMRMRQVLAPFFCQLAQN